MKLRLLLACAAMIVTATPAVASEEEANVWLSQFATINVNDKVYIRFEAQERFTNDGKRLGQLLLRSLAAYRINKNVNLGAGYAFILTDRLNSVELNEHRFYQELNVRIVTTKTGLTVDSRTRLEQRTFEEREKTAWRLRQFVQLRVPLSDQGHRFIAYTEPFVDLNETDVQRGGLSVWRNFVGVSIPLGKGVEIVPGYLNQHVFRNGQDRTDHTANINLFMNL